MAQSLPTGGVVVAGQATIAQPSSTLLNVNTATSRTAIQWQSFSIGSGNTVSIQQPNAASITLNSVIGPDPSQVFGTLKSNGQVVVANPNGIWFGPNSRVDVSGLVASTASVSKAALQAFAAGGQLKLGQSGNADATVVNDGNISVADQGLAALVAPNVKNSGVIVAKLGQVTLASGTTATVDFYGDGLVSFAVGGKVNAAGLAGTASVSNTGTIAAAGGQILLTAAAAANVVNTTINMSGVVQAASATTAGGDIVLDGGHSGTVTVSGVADASSTAAKGGNVQVLGNQIVLASTAKIDASGATGGGNIAIGGGAQGRGGLQQAVATTIGKGATIAADAMVNGDGGKVVVWSDGQTTFAGKISARGAGKGKGGSIETSGHTLDFSGGTIDASAPSGLTGDWLLDPTSLELTTTDQASISTALNGGTSVTLQTTSDGPTGGYGTSSPNDPNGDITVDSAGSGSGISWNSNAAFTLYSYGSVLINDGAKIVNAGSGSINFYADVGENSPTADITIGSAQVQSQGSITLSSSSGGTVTVSGVLSGSSIAIYDDGGVGFSPESSVTAINGGAISIGPSGSSSPQPSVDLAGTLTAASLTITAGDAGFEDGSSTILSNSLLLKLSDNLITSSAPSFFLTSPTVEIDYSGIKVNLGGSAQNSDSTLNLSAAAVNALASGATTSFIVRDTDSTGESQLTTSGNLTFPGGLTLSVGEFGTLSLGGSLSYNGAANFDASNSADLAVTGTISNSPTSNSTSSFYSDGSLSIEADASITAPAGLINLLNYYGTFSVDTDTISGTISGNGVEIRNNVGIALASGSVINGGTGSVLLHGYYSSPAIDEAGSITGSSVTLTSSSLSLESTALISGTSSVTLSATTGFSVPDTQATAIITNSPSIEIDYSGGSIGLGTATVGGDGAVNLTAAALNALDSSAFNVITINDTTSGGTIATGGALSFPGALILNAGSQDSVLSLGGSLTLAGYGGFTANSNNSSGGQISVTGAIIGNGTSGIQFNEYGAFNEASGASITATAGGVNILNYYGTIASDTDTIGGAISGSSIDIRNNTGVSLSSGSVVNAGTGSVTIHGYYTSPAIDDGGAIGGGSVSLTSTSLTLEGSAQITGTSSVLLSATTGFSVPDTQATAIITNSPSVEIDYSGGSIGLGTATVVGDGAVNLTTAALNALDSGATTSFTVNDTASSGTIATGGALSFPGALTLDVATSGLLNLGGSINIAGYGYLNANSNSSNGGQISVTGAITGGSTSGLLFSEGGAFNQASGASITATAGSVQILNYYGTIASDTDAIGGAISGSGIEIRNNVGVSLTAGSVINAGTNNLTILGYYSSPAIDDAGSVSGGAVSFTSTSLTLESTALISGTGSVLLSASTGFTVPDAQSSAIITNSPSIEIDYSGGSIGLGTATVQGTGAVNLTAAALNALDASATGIFTINDTASGGTIATGGALSFPGGLTLDIGTSGLLDLGGSLSIAGYGYFNANTYSTYDGQISVTGAIIDSSTSGLLFSEGGAFSEASGASITATAGQVLIRNYYGTIASDTDAIGGAISGSGIEIRNNVGVSLTVGSAVNAGTNNLTILGYYSSPAIDDAGSVSGGTVTLTSSSLTLESTALITGTSGVVLSATTGFSVPDAQSTAIIVNSPSVEIDYSGGSIGLGTATVGGDGAVNLTATAVNALDAGATTSFTVNDTTSGGTIATGGALSFPGALTLDIGTLGVLDLGGSLSIAGAASLGYYYYYYYSPGSQINVTGTVSDTSTSGIAFYASDAFTVGSGAAVTASAGAVSIVNAGTTGTTINGTVSGLGVTVQDNTAITLGAGSVVDSGTAALTLEEYNSIPNVDVAGTLTGGSINIQAASLTLESTALITGTSGVVLSATTGFSVPDAQSTAIIVNSSSVEIDYSGGSIGLGTATVGGTGAVNLTAAAVNALDAGAITSFTVNDTTSGGTIATGGALSFPGALTLEVGTLGVINLGGSLIIAGAATFDNNYYYYYNNIADVNVTGTVVVGGAAGLTLNTTSFDLSPGASISATAGTVDITSYGSNTSNVIGGSISAGGSISISNYGASGVIIATGAISSNSGVEFYNQGTSGSTTIGDQITAPNVFIYDQNAITLTSGAVINGGTGSVSLGESYNNIPIIDVGGTISGTYVDLYGSTVTLESTAALSASSSLSFVASTGLVIIPGPSAAIVTNAPNVSIQYSGGPIELGTATSMAAGALNLGPAALQALGLGTATGSFTVYDSAGSGSITLDGTIATPGTLTLEENSQTIPIMISGVVLASSLDISYPVSLIGDTTLDTSAYNGTISLGAIDGAYNLTVKSGTAYSYFGTIGGTTALSSLSISSGDAYLTTTNISNSLTINALDTIYISGAVSVADGPIVLRSDIGANSYDSIYFYNGGSITSAGVLTSYYHPSDYGNTIDFATVAPNASSIQAYLLVDNVNDLGDIENNLSANYLVNADIVGTTTNGGVSPIGSSQAPFTGVFDGQGHTISNLTVTDSGADDVGLVRDNAGIIENVTFSNITINASGNTQGGGEPIGGTGGLVGQNSGSILNITISGAITSTGDSGHGIGGLVGNNEAGGLIKGDTSSVTIDAFDGYLGGLAGGNSGAISLSTASGSVTSNDDETAGGLVASNFGTISQSSATGAVTVGNGSNVGGLVAVNYATIVQSYSTGAVTAGDSNSATGQFNGTNAGGLVGWNYGGSVTDSFSTSSVHIGSVVSGAPENIGGLVGLNYAGIATSYAAGYLSFGTGAAVGGLVGSNSGSVTNSYFDTDTTGLLTDNGGATPLSSAELTSGNLPAGFGVPPWSASAGYLPMLSFQTSPLLPPTNMGTTDTVAGTVFASLGGSAVGGTGVDLIVDGIDFGMTTTGSAGNYTFTFSNTQLTSAATHETLAYLTGSGLSGSAIYDGAVLSLGGLNIYENMAMLTTPMTSLASAVSALQTTLNAATPANSLVNVGNGTITTVNNAGLTINALAAAFTIDEAVNAGSGAVALEGAGSVTQTQSITASSLVLPSAISYTLTNSGNSVGTVTGSVNSVDFIDGTNFNLGTTGLQATGAVSLTAIGTIDITAPLSAASLAVAAGTIIVEADQTVNSLSNATYTIGYDGDGGGGFVLNGGTLVSTATTSITNSVNATGPSAVTLNGEVDADDFKLAANGSQPIDINVQGGNIASGSDILLNTGVGGTLQLGDASLSAGGTISLIGDGISLATPTLNSSVLVLDAASQGTSIAFDSSSDIGSISISGSYNGSTPTVDIGDASNSINFDGTVGFGASDVNVLGNVITLYGTSVFKVPNNNLTFTGTSFVDAAGSTTTAQSIKIAAATIDIAGSLTGTGPQSGNAIEFDGSNGVGSLILESGASLVASGATSGNSTLALEISNLTVADPTAVNISAGSVFIYNPDGPLVQGPGMAAIGIGTTSGQLQLSQGILDLLSGGSNGNVIIVGSVSDGAPPNGQTVEIGGNVNLAGSFVIDAPYIVVDNNTVLNNTGTNAGLTLTMFTSGTQFTLPSSASITTAGTFTLNGQSSNNSQVFSGSVSLLGQISAGTGINIFADASSNLTYNLTAVLGGSLTTSTGSIDIGVPVVLAGAGLNIATGGGNVAFAGTIDGTTAGTQNLTINAGDGTVTAGDIGDTVLLDNVSIIAGTTMLGQVNAVNESMGGDVTLGSAIVRKSFTANHLTLIGDGSIDTTQDNGTVNIGFIDGAYSLSIDAGSGSIVIGPVGSMTPLTALSLFGGTISVGSVTTLGAQSYTASNDMTAGGPLSSGGLLTLNGSGTFTLNNVSNSFGSLVASAGSINATDSVQLTLGTISANTGLTLSDTAGLVFSGPVTTSGGAISITGPAVLAADTSLTTNGGGVAFNNTIDASSAGGQSLTINAGTGNVTLGNVGTNVALNSLAITGGTVMLGAVDTTAAESYTVSGVLTTSGPLISGGLLTLNGSGTFTLTDPANSFGTLVANAGSIGLADSIQLTLGTISATTGLTLSDTAGLVFTAPVTTSGGAIDITGPSVLGADTSLTTNGGDVTFNDTIDASSAGGQSLTINAGTGDVTLGDVGTNVALNTLAITGGTVMLGAVDTTAAESYTVSGALTTSGPLISGGLLTLNGSGSYMLSDNGNQFSSLTANTGSINLVDSRALRLNSIQVVSGLTASDTAGFILVGPLTATGGDIKLTGPVTLISNSTVTSDTGNVTLDGLINGTDAGAQNLTLTAIKGTVTAGDIGTSVILGQVSIDAAQTMLGQVKAISQEVSGSTTISGTVTVNTFTGDNVILTGDGSIDTSADNGSVDIAILNGAFGLGINAGTGSVTIGTAGNLTPLTSLSVTAGLISLGSITTTGEQTYNGNIAGGNAITLAANAGSILFNGDLGTTAVRVAGLTINSADNVTLFHDDLNNIYYSLFVDNFTASITGTLSLGIHSLESDGDVSILSASVDGRIVTTGNVGVTTGSLSGTVAGNNVIITSPGNFSGSGDVNANVSGNTITVAANDFTGSATATRSANITAADTINATVSAPVATLTAGNTVEGSVSGNSVTINAPNVNEALNERQVTIVDSSTASLTGTVGGSTDLASSVNFVPSAPVGTGNNGQSLSSANLVPQSTNATQVAQNTTTATEDDVTPTDQSDSSATPAKKKTAANGENCDPKKDGACTNQVASTYDYANKYVDKLLNGGH